MTGLYIYLFIYLFIYLYIGEKQDQKNESRCAIIVSFCRVTYTSWMPLIFGHEGAVSYFVKWMGIQKQEKQWGQLRNQQVNDETCINVDEHSMTICAGCIIQTGYGMYMNMHMMACKCIIERDSEVKLPTIRTLRTQGKAEAGRAREDT